MTAREISRGIALAGMDFPRSGLVDPAQHGEVRLARSDSCGLAEASFSLLEPSARQTPHAQTPLRSTLGLR